MYEDIYVFEGCCILFHLLLCRTAQPRQKRFVACHTKLTTSIGCVVAPTVANGPVAMPPGVARKYGPMA